MLRLTLYLAVALLCAVLGTRAAVDCAATLKARHAAIVAME